jgi:molecular chaperone GrpE
MPRDEPSTGAPEEVTPATPAGVGEPAPHAEADAAPAPEGDVKPTEPEPEPETEPEPEPDPLAEAHEQAGEYLALAQRTQADFENFRRRMTREVGAAEARGVARLARELLPALDNLERALAAAEQGPAAPPELAQGFRLVHAEVAAALARVGIEGYAPQGEPFDPAVHEAMAQQPVEGAESGTIVEVYQQGYRLADTVLRPARVVVAA